jgi:protein-S-isoprenylcysteine O-methyltransferase Ste14
LGHAKGGIPDTAALPRLRTTAISKNVLRTTNNFFRQGGLWVLAQNLLTLAVLGFGPAFRGPPWHWTCIALGGTLFLAGAGFGIAGVRALGRNLTPYPRPRATAQLVQTGIYGVVRHPLYTSLIMLTLGWSLGWSSWPALVLALGLAVVLDRKARAEERWLRGKFPEYTAYSQRVRRFVPRWF